MNKCHEVASINETLLNRVSASGVQRKSLGFLLYWVKNPAVDILRQQIDG